MTRLDRSSSEFDRYAIYYAPERGSLLAELGNRWLGRDPEGCFDLSPPENLNLSMDLFGKYTATPKRYGFHGTLKAPFRLRENVHYFDLDAALLELSQRLAPASASPLKLKGFSHFFALVPSDECEEINLLSARCVDVLDAYRKPLESYELDRRRLANLTPKQDAYLEKWGYPYVFDEFRFHLTLTGNVPEALRGEFQRLIEGWMAPALKSPFVVREICLFGDPGGGLPFKLVKRYALTGTG